MPTIKEIASLAGVSRGTVDRVLNKRGAVSPQTARKVAEIAVALNYSPNLAGKTLALTKKKLKMGYILHSSPESNMFFRDVVLGIEQRTEIFKEYNASVEIRFANIKNPHLQVQQINQLLKLGINGLAIIPINHPCVAKQLSQLSQQGFPIVTANSDLMGCGRLAYVGSNHNKSGAVAAGILQLVTEGNANVGVVLGSHFLSGHSQRVKGFAQHLAKKSTKIKKMKIVQVVENNDNDIDSFILTTKMLKDHPEINALYLAAGGVQGACKAVEDLGFAGKIKIVTNDITPAIRELMCDDVICASIGQQPHIQGTKPLDILLDYLGMGIKPDKEIYYTNTEIYIAENL